MKKLKEITKELRLLIDQQDENRHLLIRKFILYSPKMPLRLHQQQLIAESKQFQLSVYDAYFTQSNLNINCFSWGKGKTKVLLTHGWASKGLDFYELIVELRKIDDLEIITFDAPGNGSSISELSNLILYVNSIKAIYSNYAKPNIIIGHSLGVMANAIAIQELAFEPDLSISIAPLIRLKENFEQSLNLLEITQTDQETFFTNFADEVNVPASHFNIIERYTPNANQNHFLAFDPDDYISPYAYLKDFLDINPSINAKSYHDIGHYKILKSAVLINDVVEKVKILA
ncbi:alpha/beta fold hydrolase [Pedobacter mucosus]|uniref:alpha/beta fold hydrolase n=1 Tax=Pedobacter mucosus TaxID=2895286 RepID=UPI001EE4D966|nr:alpha/beta hydrolase [Pedobacter mucosus]UKT64543.1 alpha/beta hydrolase [Pedobacter mucosus]